MAVMKKVSFISAGIILLVFCSYSRVLVAQEKSKELQELIIEQKKAMVDKQKAFADQQKVQEEIQKVLDEHKDEIEQALEKARIKIDDPEFKRAYRIYGMDRNKSFSTGEPFIIDAPGLGYYLNPLGNSEKSTWDFSKSVKESSFSRDYIFDVEPEAKSVIMSVSGDCKEGEIRIRIIMPGGKTFSEIIIDEFGNLNWRKSLTISDTENQDKTGAWKFEIKSSKASGYFRIFFQTS
jgi:hypothetical protein